MKKKYDDVVGKLAKMSRSCYVHGTEVTDAKERELWFEQGRTLSDMMEEIAMRNFKKGLMWVIGLSVFIGMGIERIIHNK